MRYPGVGSLIIEPKVKKINCLFKKHTARAHLKKWEMPVRVSRKKEQGGVKLSKGWIIFFQYPQV